MDLGRRGYVSTGADCGAGRRRIHAVSSGRDRAGRSDQDRARARRSRSAGPRRVRFALRATAPGQRSTEVSPTDTRPQGLLLAAPKHRLTARRPFGRRRRPPTSQPGTRGVASRTSAVRVRSREATPAGGQAARHGGDGRISRLHHRARRSHGVSAAGSGGVAPATIGARRERVAGTRRAARRGAHVGHNDAGHRSGRRRHVDGRRTVPLRRSQPDDKSGGVSVRRAVRHFCRALRCARHARLGANRLRQFDCRTNRSGCRLAG